MRHLLLLRGEKRKGEKREIRKKERGKEGEAKGEGEAKCSNRVAANSTLGVFNSSLFVLHSSLKFFTLRSSLPSSLAP